MSPQLLLLNLAAVVFTVVLIQISWLMWMQSSNCHCQSPSSSFYIHQSGEEDCTTSTADSNSSFGLTSDQPKKHYVLFVMVLSSLSTTSKNRRNTIRDTWMQCTKELQSQVLVKFIIGTCRVSGADMQALQEEKEQYQDIEFLPIFRESYDRLTAKVLAGFVWADQSLNFSYLLKTDDDSFVRLDKFVEELHKRTSFESYYWGFFSGDRKPMKTGKWQETNWFLCDHYLPYAFGGGYVLSHDLVHQLAMNADALQHYICEDVTVGVWLSPYKIERRHDTRFDTTSESRGCNNVYIIQHNVDMEGMRKKYKTLQTEGNLCKKEFVNYFSYVYDWHAEPTKCCTPEGGIP